MANNTTVQNQTQTSFLQELWTEAVLGYAERQYEIRNNIMDFSSLAGGQKGEKINVPILNAETANNYTGQKTDSGNEIDTGVTFSNDTDAEGLITCNQQPAVGKRIADMVAVQSSFDVFDGFARSMGNAIGKHFNDAVLTELMTTTNTVDTGSTGAGALTVAQAETGVQNAIADLIASDVDITDGDLFLYCSPSYYSLLLQSTSFSHALNRGDAQNPVVTGALGMIYGAKVYANSAGALEATGTDANKIGVLYHRNAMGCAFSIEPNVKAQENVAYLSTDLVASSCYGVSLLVNDLACVITD